MELYREPIVYNDPLLRIQVRSFHSTVICQHGWHSHPELEIIAVRSGTMEIHTAEEVYHLQAGDVLILGSSQPHLDLRKSNQFVDYVVIQFELGTFLDSNMLPFLYMFQESVHPLVRINAWFRENSELRQQFYSTVIELQRDYEQRQRGYEMAVNYLVKKCSCHTSTSCLNESTIVLPKAIKTPSPPELTKRPFLVKADEHNRIA